MIADISGLAVPRMPVRLSLGKNSALATPTCALARTSCCSTWRRSGRRSSRVEGNPAGTVGTTGCPYIGVPRGIGAGALPRRMLIWFSFATTWFSSSGMFACAPPSAPSARAVWSLEATPEPQAILEQVVGALERLGAVARDLELHVQREQLEVRLSQVADQRQPHAAPRLLGGQQVRARGLVGSADAPPDVQLPLGGERPQEEVRRGVLRHLGRDPGRGQGVATARRRRSCSRSAGRTASAPPRPGRALPACGRRRSSRRSCWRALPG